MSSSFKQRALTWLLTKTFRLLYFKTLLRFEASLRDPNKAQAETLKRILNQASRTEYGRYYGIHSGISLEQFRKSVPVVDYDAIAPWVERQTKSSSEILTPNSIRVFEKTSGSRGPSKWIPYNSAHLKTFERMFVLWALRLLGNGLKLKSGRVFFLISPKTKTSESVESKVPVGFKDDSEYLGGLTNRIAKRFFVDAPQLHHSSNYIADLAICLLNETELEVISVWSPSLLVLVMEHIESERENLLLSRALNSEAKARLRRDVGAKSLWPELKLVSCWDSATSRHDATKVRELFSDVKVQGKGLLATEAAITLPWGKFGAAVPLVEDIYFEFIDDATGAVKTLEEIRIGEKYEVVITAPNGFLRYRMGDLVRITGCIAATPTFEFLGRKEAISDLAGEKLNSTFVSNALTKCGFVEFAILVPERDQNRKRYTLLTTRQNLTDQARALETELSTQHHYRLARDMGQLEEARVISVPNLREQYYKILSERGTPAGQVKNTHLVTDYDLADKILSTIRSSQETGSHDPKLLLCKSIL